MRNFQKTNKAVALCRKFIRDEKGATALEYALIASLIAVAVIGGLTAIGDGVNGSMNKASEELKTSRN